MHEDAHCPYCGHPVCAHADERGYYRCPPDPPRTTWRQRLARKLAAALAELSRLVGQ